MTLEQILYGMKIYSENGIDFILYITSTGRIQTPA